MIARANRNQSGTAAVVRAVAEVLESRTLLSAHGNGKGNGTGGEIVGTPVSGDAGITLSITQLNALQASAGDAVAPPDGEAEFDLRERTLSTKHQPGSPKVSQTRTVSQRRTSKGGTVTQSPYLPQTIGTNFVGATLADTSAFPPDSMGAIGPTQYIVAVNGRIRSFNKTTGVADGALNLNTDTFWSSVETPLGGGIGFNFTSDPRIRYDRLSGRWILTMIDVPSTNSTNMIGDHRNRVMIAVSNGGTITSTSNFTFYFFQAGGASGASTDFLDYETLGVDANALYIGGNMFSTSGSFLRTDGYVVRKSSVLSGGPIVFTTFKDLTSGGPGPLTPQGVDNFAAAATEGYFIGVDNLVFSQLDIRRISTPGGTPTISGNLTLTVAPTVLPISVPHLGNTGGTIGQLDALDDRLFAATVRNGHLWTAHNIQVNGSGVASNTGGRDGIRWYDLTNLTTTPIVNQFGTVFDSAATNPRSYFIPSIMVNGQGHAAMGSSTAGANEHANAAAMGRLAGDSTGTMQAATLYTASSTAYNPPGDPGDPAHNQPRRWGDYSYTSLDPNDDMTMWTIQEYCNATNTYAVRVAKLLAPPPATPSSTSPVSVVQGFTGNVTVTGSVVSGSGFFDPGAGFANHISAVVNGGGVTVNSVTYTDPTHITLNITVAGAAAVGSRTITVTNPDGQALTSASGILTITSAGGTISGTVFQDNNGNATRDGSPTEPVITTGVTVFLDTNNNANLDGGEPSQVSDGSGNFSFTALADGTYHLREQTPSGFIRTSAAPIDVVISGGNTQSGKDIGNFPITFTGGMSNNTFIVSTVGGTNTQIVTNLPPNPAVTYTIAKTTLGNNPLTFNGGPADDALTIDQTAGNPLTNGGAVFNAGAQTTADTITYLATSGADVANFNNGVIGNAGSPITHGGSVEAITYDGEGGNDAINFTGGPPVTFPTSQHFASLTMNGGLAILAANGSRFISTNSLSISGTGRLDLKDNDLIVRGGTVGSATGGIYDGISGLIQSGRNGGGWNGTTGIITSSASGNFTTLGIATFQQVKALTNPTDTTTYAGETVIGNDVLVKFTYGGDANLDGKLNIDDYGKIDFNINLGTSGWFNGDFNYDGKVNVDDYGIIDFNIGTQGPPL